MSPRLVTFAHDRAGIDAAVAAGADHLIFEDPRVSIRSWIQHASDGWDYLGELVQHARAARSDIRISFNCDGLYRGAQMPVVEQAIAAAAFAGVDAIRVMDAGLRRRLNQLAPDCALELATEMGNCSIPCSAQYAREGFTYQVYQRLAPSRFIGFGA